MELWYTFVNNRGTINVKTVHFMSMVRSKSSGNLTSVRKACLCSGKCLAMQCLFFVFATIDLSLCIHSNFCNDQCCNGQSLQHWLLRVATIHLSLCMQTGFVTTDIPLCIQTGFVTSNFSLCIQTGCAMIDLSL